AEALRVAHASLREGLRRTAERLARLGALREGLEVGEATDVLWFHLGNGAYLVDVGGGAVAGVTEAAVAKVRDDTTREANGGDVEDHLVHARGAPESAGTGHVAAVGGRPGAQGPRPAVALGSVQAAIITRYVRSRGARTAPCRADHHTPSAAVPSTSTTSAI